MWGVMRFYNLLRIGITWKGPEIIELWQSSSDTEKLSISQEYLTTDGYFYRTTPDQRYLSTDITSDDDDENPQYERCCDDDAGSGSDEDDSLLVAYDSNSIVSVWQHGSRKNNKMQQQQCKNLNKKHFYAFTPTNGMTLLCFSICMIELYVEILFMKNYF